MNSVNKFNREKELKIISMYESGKTQKEIALYFNTWNTSIRRVLLRNNIDIRGNSEIQRFVKTNPFRDGDEKSDYFLGLLVTDGCISGKTVTLGLKEEDVYMLEQFASFLDSRVNVNRYFHTKHNKYQYEVKFKNPDTVEYLKNRAIFYKKSFNLRFNIPLNWDIFRGISDGDGGFYSINNEKGIKWTLTSASYAFTIQVKKFLENGGYHPTLVRKLPNMHILSLYRQKEIKKLFTDLYQDANIFLKRKYLKLATFLEKSGM